MKKCNFDKGMFFAATAEYTSQIITWKHSPPIKSPFVEQVRGRVKEQEVTYNMKELVNVGQGKFFWDHLKEEQLAKETEPDNDKKTKNERRVGAGGVEEGWDKSICIPFLHDLHFSLGLSPVLIHLR